jgi:hypothetical protein
MEGTDKSVRLGSRPQAAAGRDLFTLGALLFAPMLLIVPLSFFGEAFGWVVGISLGWMLGLALVWSSRSWTSAEKGLATLVWPGGLAPALLPVTMTGEVCERTGGGVEVCTGFSLPVWLGIPTLIASVAAPLIVAVILLNRSSTRRTATTGSPPALR